MPPLASSQNKSGTRKGVLIGFRTNLFVRGHGIRNGAPPRLLVGLSNGILQVSWPSNYTGGWRLQAQTNTASAGLGTNWVDLPNSSGVTQISLPVDLANRAVFFRLVYP